MAQLPIGSEMEVSPDKADLGDKLGENLNSVETNDARRALDSHIQKSPPAKRQDTSMSPNTVAAKAIGSPVTHYTDGQTSGWANTNISGAGKNLFGNSDDLEATYENLEKELNEVHKEHTDNELEQLTTDQIIWMQTEHSLPIEDNIPRQKIISFKREESVQFSLQHDGEYLQRCIDTLWVEDYIYNNGKGSIPKQIAREIHDNMDAWQRQLLENEGHLWLEITRECRASTSPPMREIFPLKNLKIETINFPHRFADDLTVNVTFTYFSNEHTKILARYLVISYLQSVLETGIWRETYSASKQQFAQHLENNPPQQTDINADETDQSQGKKDQSDQTDQGIPHVGDDKDEDASVDSDDENNPFNLTEEEKGLELEVCFITKVSQRKRIDSVDENQTTKKVKNPLIIIDLATRTDRPIGGMHTVLEEHRKLATANLRYINELAPSTGIINEGTTDSWSVVEPFTLVSHSESDVLQLRVDIEALKDDGGQVNLLSYPWVSIVPCKYKAPGTGRIRTGITVVEFRLEEHGKCKHCLGRLPHRPKEKCPGFGRCRFCWQTMTPHIHAHLAKDCTVVKALIDKGLYTLPTLPNFEPKAPPTFKSEHAKTLMGKSSLSQPQKKIKKSKKLSREEHKRAMQKARDQQKKKRDFKAFMETMKKKEEEEQSFQV